MGPHGEGHKKPTHGGEGGHGAFRHKHVWGRVVGGIDASRPNASADFMAPAPVGVVHIYGTTPFANGPFISLRLPFGHPGGPFWHLVSTLGDSRMDTRWSGTGLSLIWSRFRGPFSRICWALRREFSILFVALFPGHFSHRIFEVETWTPKALKTRFSK